MASESATASGQTSGTIVVATSGQIVVSAASNLATISRGELGLNLGMWYDITSSAMGHDVAAAGAHIVRWPGGSISDQFHWQGFTLCSSAGNSQPANNPNSTYDNFMKTIVIDAGYDVAMTVAYGSNVACNGGADPSEAAAWVADAKAKGYNSHIHNWTIGNEVYGGWELDLHPSPHDPAVYAAAVSGPGGFYALMKAADPTAQIGVVVNTEGLEGGPGNWDSIVLPNTPYDYVELHHYVQQTGAESDDYLLNHAPASLTNAIVTVRSDLTQAGRQNVPIMIGEFNSVNSSPGKQSMSIVNALFTGMALGEILNDGLAIANMWFGVGGNQLCGVNNSPSLYGFQNFGGYDVVAFDTLYNWNGCNAGPIVPEGTVFPSGNAFALASQFATPGSRMLAVTVGSALSPVRAYAATQGSGYALMLFNLSETAAASAQVEIADGSRASYLATSSTYGKLQYDDSQNNVWTGPVTANLGTIATTVALTLPVWSMTLLTLK